MIYPTQTINFHYFPSDIRNLIINQCDKRSILSLKATCRLFQKDLSSYVWKRLYELDFNNLYKQQIRKSKSLSPIEWKNLYQTQKARVKKDKKIKQNLMKGSYKQFELTSKVANQGNISFISIKEDSLISADDKGNINKWDLLNRQLIFSIHSPFCFVDVIDRMIATGDQNGYVRLYKLEDGKPLVEFKAHDQAITSVKVKKINDNRSVTLTTGKEGSLKIWEKDTSQPIHSILIPSFNNRTNYIVKTKLQNKTAVTVDTQGIIRCWDLLTGKEGVKIENQLQGNCTSLETTKHKIIYAITPFANLTEDKIFVGNLKTGRILYTISRTANKEIPIKIYQDQLIYITSEKSIKARKEGDRSGEKLISYKTKSSIGQFEIFLPFIITLASSAPDNRKISIWHSGKKQPLHECERQVKELAPSVIEASSSGYIAMGYTEGKIEAVSYTQNA